MRDLIKFTIFCNLLAIVLIFLVRMISHNVATWKPIDLMFLTGVFFWLMSTLVRLGGQRFKQDWERNETIVTDPQLVLHSNSLAFRFLIAGVPGILGALVWGVFY